MPILSALLVGSLFFLSGATSLVYQNLWIRTLSLGVGSTSASMSIVLSIFFFGLALGSYLSGKIASRIDRPLVFYGYVEGLIGIYAIGAIYILFNFHSIMALLPLTGTFSWLGTFLKFAIVFLLLITPTVAMGSTLPLLIRLFLRKNEQLGKYIALLYGVNTLGAVFGAFMTGFFFIPTFGIMMSNHGAAVVNILILVAAVLIQKKNDRLWTLKTQSYAESSSMTSLRSIANTPFRKIILLCCGVTGFTSITAEVVWNKYLGIFFGSNIFGLSLILAIFLTGIALGSIILSIFIDRIEDKKSLFFSFLLTAIVLTVGATYALNYAPVAANIVAYYTGTTFSLLTIKSALTAIILFFPTSFYGALLPLGIRILLDSADDGPEVSGVAYSINTVGAILGAYLAGIVLIPWVGSAITIKIAILLLIATGAALVFFANLQKTRQAVFLSLFAVAMVGTIFGQGIEFRNIIKSAYHQYTPNNMSLSEALRYFTNDENAEEFKRIFEGETAIISLSQDPSEGEDYRDYLRLKTNGLNESYYDLKDLDSLPKYEALLGFLPYALSYNPQKAFIVGYGGGYSVNFLTSTDLKQVHVAELEKGIIQAADYVHNGKNPLLERENLKLAIEDARFVMAAKLGGPFDIIISQPSHSWLSGVANLFTKDFFEIVSSNLTEKGVFSQWLNLYNMNTEVLKSILRTFYTVFPHGAVFTDVNDEELIMIGSNQPLKFNFQKLSAMAKSEVFRNKLQQIPYNNAYDLISQLTISRERVMEITEGAVLNTDENAYAEVRQSRLFYDSRVLRPGEFLNEKFVADYNDLVDDRVVSRPEFIQGVLSSVHAKWNNFYKMHVLFEEYERRSGNDPKHLYQQGLFAQQMERFVTSRAALDKVLEQAPSSEALEAILLTTISQSDYSDARRYLRKFAKYQTNLTNCYALEVAVNLKDKPMMNRYYRKVAGKSGEDCGYYQNIALGEYHFARNEFEKALPFLEAAYGEMSNNVALIEKLVAAYIITGNKNQADSFASYLAGARQQERERIVQLAEFYQQQGLVEDAQMLVKRAQDLLPEINTEASI